MKQTRPSAARPEERVWDPALLASSTSWKYAENIFMLDKMLFIPTIPSSLLQIGLGAAQLVAAVVCVVLCCRACCCSGPHQVILASD